MKTFIAILVIFAILVGFTWYVVADFLYTWLDWNIAKLWASLVMAVVCAAIVGGFFAAERLRQ